MKVSFTLFCAVQIQRLPTRISAIIVKMQAIPKGSLFPIKIIHGINGRELMPVVQTQDLAPSLPNPSTWGGASPVCVLQGPSSKEKPSGTRPLQWPKGDLEVYGDKM